VEEIMLKPRQILLSLALLGTAMLMPIEDVSAQIVGGAVVGGAIGGRRGAAIGATAGAVARAHRGHWHGHSGIWRGNNFYYWHRGSCWVRTAHGRTHIVASHFCRW
jgi:hypothetical protein